MKQLAVAILNLRSLPFSSGRKMTMAFHHVFVVLTVLILFIAEFLRVYLVMPYPGSQVNDTAEIAWWITTHMLWIRIIALSILLLALVRVYRNGRLWQKIALPLLLAGYVALYSMFNYRMDADSIFHEPTVKSFIPVTSSSDRNRLVIGVVVNGEAKAYPIQLIGYHHQVLDTVGKEPILVTYCTVCRSGRVYSTLVNGKHQHFRLVGMDHFNAVFEDAGTKSWWQQANGEAIAGPLKGSILEEIPSRQLNLEAWMRQYPQSMVMAPDPAYEERYFRLEDYDRGVMQSPLVKRDYRAWQPKSWVIGVKNENTAMAYDWNELVRKRVIQDSLSSLPILVAMETDTTSFHVYDRRLKGATLQFNTSISNDRITDRNTNSTWNMDGLCIAGPLKGSQLTRVQAYNEFWHSWSSFQENVRKYEAKPGQ